MKKILAPLAALIAGLGIGLTGISHASEPGIHCGRPVVADGKYWSIDRITRLDGRNAAYVIWVQAVCTPQSGGHGWYWRTRFAGYVNRGDWSKPFPEGMWFWENPGQIDN